MCRLVGCRRHASEYSDPDFSIRCVRVCMSRRLTVASRSTQHAPAAASLGPRLVASCEGRRFLSRPPRCALGPCPTPALCLSSWSHGGRLRRPSPAAQPVARRRAAPHGALLARSGVDRAGLAAPPRRCRRAPGPASSLSVLTRAAAGSGPRKGSAPRSASGSLLAHAPPPLPCAMAHACALHHGASFARGENREARTGRPTGYVEHRPPC